MQFQQPVAFLHVTFFAQADSWCAAHSPNTLPSPAVPALQIPHPVHARGLHSHAAYTFLHKPLCHLGHIGRETTEAPHRLLIALRAHRYPVFTTANVDACRIRMHYFQRFPIHILSDRLPLFAFRRLLALTLLRNLGMMDPARFRFVNKRLSNGVRSVPLPATDRRTNARDRMKTGATLIDGQ